MNMTGTPGSIADTPGAGADAAADVLSEVLRRVRLTGSLFFEGRFSEPWGLFTPRHFSHDSALGGLRHYTVCHLVVSGGCTLTLANATQHVVAAGDILVLPFPDEHRLSSGAPAEYRGLADLTPAGATGRISGVRHGGGGAETRIICGYVESSELISAPLFRTLPALMVERTGDDRRTTLLAQTLRDIVQQFDSEAPGSQLLLDRLMEVLFMEILRRHIARVPERAQGWFAALKDPLLARALERVHADPARQWTVAELAREAGSSRSVLASRFNAVIGRPPMDYVTAWRIQVACDRLRLRGDSIAQIAAQVGYESEAAFSRAFKRLTGASPARWREQTER